jgi:hypothetical protein
MTKRLSFADDASGEYESMIAFVAPWGDGAKRDQVISLSERLLPWEVTNSGESFADKKQYFPGGSSGFGWYNGQLNLAQIHFGEDIRAAENMEFIAQGAINNATCFLGPHRIFSPWSQTFFELVPGQGHFVRNCLESTTRATASPSPNDSPPHPPLFHRVRTPFPETHAGVVERRSASKPRATRWCRSRRRRSRSSSSPRRREE